MLSLILMLALAAPTAAEPTTPPPPAPMASATNPGANVEPAKPEAVKKVCVQETTLGSHFKKRVCATPEEWAQRRRREAEATERVNARDSFCSGSNC